MLTQNKPLTKAINIEVSILIETKGANRSK